MALKPHQQRILAVMRTGIPLYHNRKTGGFYLRPVKSMATDPVDPYSVKLLIASGYIKKEDPPESDDEPSWLDCYRPVNVD